jgi:hypothetical protein
MGTKYWGGVEKRGTDRESGGVRNYQKENLRGELGKYMSTLDRMV